MAPSYFLLNHSMASSLEILCFAPMVVLALLLKPTRLPGRLSTT